MSSAFLGRNNHGEESKPPFGENLGKVDKTGLRNATNFMFSIASGWKKKS